MLRAAKVLSAILAVTAVTFGASAQGAPAPEQAKVMIVLDASGSMWGRVDNTPKIVIARQTIRDLMRKWDRNIQLGLSAYGHRSKGDCTDIETLYPVGTANPATIVRAVDDLQPKGMTPISEAVRRAAQQLKFTEQKATVILISDGKETCKADPCAVGKELKAAGIDFTVHVVGFDVKREEQTGLKCLAENTGGMFISASNAASLNKAVATAVTRVKEEAKTVVVQAKPKPAPKPVAKPGHQFSAVLSEGGPAAADNMTWTIYEGAANLDGKRKRVTYSTNAQPLFKLNPGKYLMVAQWGSAEKRIDFEVKSAGEAVKHVVNLDAGMIALEAVYAEGSEVIKSGMTWTVYGLEKDLQGRQTRITYSTNYGPTFRLPAGRFQIVAQRGSASLSREIDVDAGKRKPVVYNLNAGLLAPKAVLAPGTPVLKKGMTFTLYDLEKNIEGKRTRITYNTNYGPTFTLTEGKYLLVTQNGNAEVSTEVAVKAGKRNDFEVDLKAGMVRTTAVLAPGTPVLKKGMTFTIYNLEKNLEGKRTRVTYSTNYGPTFTLPAGKYLLVTQNGNAENSAEIEVAAGKQSQTEVDLNGGQIKLVAFSKDGTQLTKGVTWTIFGAEKNLEGKRQRVTYSTNATPIFTLNAGQYVVTFASGSVNVETELEVKAGDSKQVDVKVD